jgi:hypothetical protein
MGNDCAANMEALHFSSALDKLEAPQVCNDGFISISQSSMRPHSPPPATWPADGEMTVAKKMRSLFVNPPRTFSVPEILRRAALSCRAAMQIGLEWL